MNGVPNDPPSLRPRGVDAGAIHQLESRGRDDHRWAPPAQNRTGALTHTALTSDVWRRSVAGDRDAAPVGKESSDQEAVYAAATPPGHVDYDEPKRSATIAAADA